MAEQQCGTCGENRCTNSDGIYCYEPNGPCDRCHGGQHCEGRNH